PRHLLHRLRAGGEGHGGGQKAGTENGERRLHATRYPGSSIRGLSSKPSMLRASPPWPSQVKRSLSSEAHAPRRRTLLRENFVLTASGTRPILRLEMAEATKPRET